MHYSHVIDDALETRVGAKSSTARCSSISAARATGCSPFTLETILAAELWGIDASTSPRSRTPRSSPASIFPRGGSRRLCAP